MHSSSIMATHGPLHKSNTPKQSITKLSINVDIKHSNNDL